MRGHFKDLSHSIFSHSLTYSLDPQETVGSILKDLPLKALYFLRRQQSHLVHLLDGPLLVAVATHKVALTLWKTHKHLRSSNSPISTVHGGQKRAEKQSDSRVSI